MVIDSFAQFDVGFGPHCSAFCVHFVVLLFSCALPCSFSRWGLMHGCAHLAQLHPATFTRQETRVAQYQKHLFFTFFQKKNKVNTQITFCTPPAKCLVACVSLWLGATLPRGHNVDVPQEGCPPMPLGDYTLSMLFCPSYICFASCMNVIRLVVVTLTCFNGRASHPPAPHLNGPPMPMDPPPSNKESWPPWPMDPPLGRRITPPTRIFHQGAHEVPFFFALFLWSMVAYDGHMVLLCWCGGAL